MNAAQNIKEFYAEFYARKWINRLDYYIFEIKRRSPTDAYQYILHELEDELDQWTSVFSIASFVKDDAADEGQDAIVKANKIILYWLANVDVLLELADVLGELLDKSTR